jgi:glycerophosphoryl diester phosphodiesterase
VKFKSTSDHIQTLQQLLTQVAGRVPLILEMKSRFDGDMRLPARLADVARDYSGPVAAMSFDPAQVAEIARLAPGLPRGIVAERWYRHPEWALLSWWQKQALGNLLHVFRTRPHFVNYSVKDLPATAPLLARHVFGMPLLAWTVRTPDDRRRARFWASQMVFEGFRP